jgi:hypothetical protein
LGSHKTRTIVESSISKERCNINFEIRRKALWEELKVELVIFQKNEFAKGWPTVITCGHLRGRSSMELALADLSVSRSA